MAIASVLNSEVVT